jgi:WD40 repeat protein
VIHDLETGAQVYIPSHGDRGVGAIALHPDKTFLAVGEKGENPVIAIYTIPDFKLVRMLRNGTHRAYSCLAFSAKGDKLASVGSNPDYMLTVWKWRQETTILRSKAFSSDVYRVSFAAGNDGQLTTCGAGHIRFWKVGTVLLTFC